MLVEVPLPWPKDVSEHSLLAPFTEADPPKRFVHKFRGKLTVIESRSPAKTCFDMWLARGIDVSTYTDSWRGVVGCSFDD